MRLNSSNFVSKLAGLVGVTGVSLFALPAGANEVLNPNPSVFTESTFSRSERVLINTQYVPNKVETTTKQNRRVRTIAQGKPVLNPNPSIFQECPFNRAACPGGSGTTPTTPGTTPSVETPEAVPTPVETPEAVPTPVETPEAVPTPVETPEAVPTPTTPEATPTPGTTTPPTTNPQGTTGGDNIVALAEKNGSFTFLTKALKAAGLVETLQGAGPFTVFAPTDKAFAELPPDAVQDLLKPENKAILEKILKYHVVSGQVLSTDLKSGDVKSVEGGAITVSVDSDKKSVRVNDANVVQPDIKGSNGVIHVIDKVILPPNL
jgi:uncharacterized surface protein with fasciclin (FAS1) repeats